MIRIMNTPRIIASLVLAALLLAALAGAGPAAAQESETEAVQLSIKPLNSPDSYFTLTGSPGEVIQLEVELANHGTSPIEVRTYPADAYSLVNGGFGVELDEEPTSGATHWLDYPVETFEIDAATAIRRTFALTIPEDATSGEYLSALVIQNANPTGGESEGIGFKQVNRQAIAVAIEIPGERLPGIAIGDLEHQFTAGRSVITAEVENTGNVHLKPDGEFVLVDGDGSEVLRTPVTMGSVYAGTATLLEVPFSDPLAAGEYLASLELADATEQVSAEVSQVAITVPEMAAPPVPVNPEPAESGQANPAPQPGGAAATNDATDPAGAPAITPWMLVAGVAAALILGAGAALGVVAISRRRRNTNTPAPSVVAASPAVPAPEIAAPAAPEPADVVPVPATAPEPVAVAPEVRTTRPVATSGTALHRPSSSVRQLLNKSKQARGSGPATPVPATEAISFD